MFAGDAFVYQFFLVFKYLVERALGNVQAFGYVVHAYSLDAFFLKGFKCTDRDATAQFYLAVFRIF